MLALAVLLPLIAWRVYARFKRMVGRQRLTKYKLWIQLSLFPAQSPLTLFVFGLLAGYYISYAVGLSLWRAKVLRAKRLRLEGEPGDH